MLHISISPLYIANAAVCYILWLYTCSDQGRGEQILISDVQQCTAEGVAKIEQKIHWPSLKELKIGGFNFKGLHSKNTKIKYALILTEINKLVLDFKNLKLLKFSFATSIINHELSNATCSKNKKGS